MIELSVVIPSHDAGPRLSACLEALTRQEGADGTFEVIVVDDGSKPPIDPGLRAPEDRYPIRVLRREVAGGPGAARNEGWRAARGRICLFLDDDVIGDAGLVAGHLAAHRAADAAGTPAVGAGRMTTQVGPRPDWFLDLYQDQWNQAFMALDGGRPPTAANCYSGNMSVPTELLRKSRGFDTAYTRSEDVELAARLVEMGARPTYVPGDNRHLERKTSRQLMADARDTGRTAPKLAERHPWLLDETLLGTYAHCGQRQLLGRRIATALGLRPETLSRLGPLLGHGRRGRSGVLLLTELAYWQGVRAVVSKDEFARMSDGTAILMYHAFAPRGSRGTRFVVPVDRFEAQLKGLLERGYFPLSLSAYLRHRQEHSFPPARSFVVTIDDGYTDVEDLAAPILRRLGIPAAICVVEAALGRHNDWDREGPLARRPILDLGALDRLREKGFEFVGHSATHRPLAGCPPATLLEEIQEANGRLAMRLGALVPAFAYPFGVADAAARAAVSDAGLAGLGAVLDDGLACPASPADYLPRIEVRGTDSPLRLALAARIGGTRRLLLRR